MLEEYLRNYLFYFKLFISYIDAHLTAFSAVLLLIFLVLIFIVMKLSENTSDKKAVKLKVKPQKLNDAVITRHDIQAIAGDDIVTTQLDLARAYIETGQNILAKPILQEVIKQGNFIQLQEAKQLLKGL